LRLMSCILSLVIGLTVMLSGAGDVQSNSTNFGAGHHGMSVTVATGMSHDEHSSHPDLCGMAVCGPFVQEITVFWRVIPTVFPVMYWNEHRQLVAVSVDVTAKPPRS
jgi:hypothetical protein